MLFTTPVSNANPHYRLEHPQLQDHPHIPSLRSLGVHRHPDLSPTLAELPSPSVPEQRVQELQKETSPKHNIYSPQVVTFQQSVRSHVPHRPIYAPASAELPSPSVSEHGIQKPRNTTLRSHDDHDYKDVHQGQQSLRARL